MKRWMTLLLALALLLGMGASAHALTSTERYNINLFLSNFTEQGFCWKDRGYYASQDVDTALLTEFAINHCWFNRQNRIEWGDYFGGNNVRLPEEQIAPIVEKYFGLKIKPNHSLDYIDYKNGYYYWEETGGHVSDGFACLSDIRDYGDGYCWVNFDIYGMGSDWNNDVCYYTPAEADRYYPREEWEMYSGYAIIKTGRYGLSDREGWSLDTYVMFD